MSSPPDPAHDATAQLAALAAFLRRAAASRWEIGYGEAEALAERLAERLREVLPAEERAAAEWRAMPRGGLFVLGLLAYHLDLRLPLAGEGPASPGPLVLVDDCALSGLRLRQALEAEATGRDRPVVVAHLVSPPPLRRAVEAAEPRVRACVAGADLEDRLEDLHPDPADRRAWRRRWQARVEADRRYWLGMPPMVSFPWGEPDRPFWNAARQRMEDGWRFVPPHRCLKNRARLARDLPPIPAAPDAGPFWRMADEVAWGDFDDGVLWLCHTGSEQVYSLDGTARRAVQALVTGRGSEGAARVLAAEFDVTPEAARRDVEVLVEELRRNGLLVPAVSSEERPGGGERPAGGAASGPEHGEGRGGG